MGARVAAAVRSSPYKNLRTRFKHATSMATHRRVTLLGLLRVAGEDNETSLVGLETLHVHHLTLLAQVPPPMVDDDADTTRLLLANTSLLELSQSEAAALADFPVVAHGLPTDCGAEEREGANTEFGGLRLASLAATELAAGLVEPGADTALPVLAEVVGVEDCGSQASA